MRRCISQEGKITGYQFNLCRGLWSLRPDSHYFIYIYITSYIESLQFHIVNGRSKFWELFSVFSTPTHAYPWAPDECFPKWSWTEIKSTKVKANSLTWTLLLAFPKERSTMHFNGAGHIQTSLSVDWESVAAIRSVMCGIRQAHSCPVLSHTFLSCWRSCSFSSAFSRCHPIPLICVFESSFVCSAEGWRPFMAGKCKQESNDW